MTSSELADARELISLKVGYIFESDGPHVIPGCTRIVFQLPIISKNVWSLL